MNRQEKIEQFAENMIAMKKVLGGTRDGFLSNFGLNRAQMEILYTLFTHKMISLKDIANQMCVTSGAVSQIVDGLEKENLVERVQDENDRRSISLKFTEKGMEKFEEFKKSHIERMGKFLEILSDEELLNLLQIQDKLISNFNQN